MKNFTKLSQSIEKVSNRNENIAKAVDFNHEIFRKIYSVLLTNSQIVSPKIADLVAFKREKKDKFSTSFEHSLYLVIQVKGTMVTARNYYRKITRNIKFLRLVIVGNVDNAVQQASTNP
ncbi:hypothetical protein BpHYR1_042668 [Brachionus plicatilis]|uniref:Uncharacterized protein n=1 Tax=Brachionus plicatilis TaxID=10195 RepID=A0A3M7PCH4_BRAPC|nr:hypothetical protein BpHYR1_042668 [Brachionus plicatilis]